MLAPIRLMRDKLEVLLGRVPACTFEPVNYMHLRNKGSLFPSLKLIAAGVSLNIDETYWQGCAVILLADVAADETPRPLAQIRSHNGSFGS